MEILNDNDIIIKDDDGKETLMKILFSYDNEERNATDVFVYEPNNEDCSIEVDHDLAGLFEIHDNMNCDRDEILIVEQEIKD